MEIKQVRDLTILSIDENRYMGISCDSCGAIGNKEYDVVKAPPNIVAYQTAKVALAELLSMGFTPIVLSDGLAVEMNDTGKELIKGFDKALSMLKTCKVHMTGSTEENMKTVQTSMGVTCIGLCDKDKLKYKKTNSTDICILLGLPLVGNEVVNNPEKILDISDYENLYLCSFIHEILPIGSRGIFSELNGLSKYNNLNFKYNDNISVDITKSAGPSCCCLVSVDSNDIENISKLTNKPVEILGSFY
jgi:hypothetical protein